MAQLRARVRAAATALTDLTATVRKPVRAELRLSQFPAETGVFWHGANVEVAAAWARP